MFGRLQMHILFADTDQFVNTKLFNGDTSLVGLPRSSKVSYAYKNYSGIARQCQYLVIDFKCGARLPGAAFMDRLS